jgi:hypothetical protein
MKITLSKTQWEEIGKKANWIKEAKWGKEVEITNPGKWEGYTLEELKSKRDAAKSRQEKREKPDPKDTSLLRELNFAIRAKTGWGKAN